MHAARRAASFLLCLFALGPATTAHEFATHLLPYKDGDLDGPKIYNRNADSRLKVGHHINSVAWATFQTGGVDLTLTTGAALTLHLEDLCRSGTLQVYALNKPITVQEHKISLGSLYYDASRPIASIPLTPDDEGRLIRIDLGKLLNAGPFHGLVLKAFDNLRADFSSKDSDVPPMIELRYVFATAEDIRKAIDAGTAAETAAAAARQAAVNADVAAMDAGKAADDAEAAATSVSSIMSSVAFHAQQAAAWAAAAEAAAAQAGSGSGNGSSSGGEIPSGFIFLTTNPVPPADYTSTGFRFNFEAPWASGTESPQSRYDLASAVIDGKLFSTGGYNGSSHTNHVQSYDPTTDTWSSHAPMLENSYLHALVESGGYLYSVGGLRPGVQVSSNLYRYHPGSDTWVALASMPGPRWHHAAVALNGTIYVFGGATSYPGQAMSDVVYAYDIANDSWSRKANLPTMRFALAGVVVNGKVWALGGKRPGEWLNTVEIYDPATDSWSGGAPMPVVRSHHNAVTDGQRIYVMGGESLGSAIINSMVQYDYASGSWEIMKPLIQARYKFAAGIISGKIYVSQGHSGGGILATTEAYSLPKVVYLMEKN